MVQVSGFRFQGPEAQAPTKILAQTHTPIHTEKHPHRDPGSDTHTDPKTHTDKARERERVHKSLLSPTAGTEEEEEEEEVVVVVVVVV